MSINKLAKEIHEINISKGFWQKPKELGTLLMLVTSELSEALEADRKGKYAGSLDIAWMESCQDPSHLYVEHFPEKIKDTVQDEIADAIIRLLDISEGYGFDMEFHIKHKMEYNKLRPKMHGKKY